MEVKTKVRCGVTRRKCNQIRKLCPKIERNASLRKVSNILRKKESLRSAEEIAVLASMSDEVKEVKFRICRRQRTLERNKEIEDESFILRNKCKKLAYALKEAKHLVVYTGAGISTAADIPDYRGPNGIWTLLQRGEEIGNHDLTKAEPTITHMALWQLYRQRLLKFIVSQNCDGLHLRSGLPRRALSEVHGNMYVEICRECKPNAQYWRLFDTTERTARYNHTTSRICHQCGAGLVDSIVHFGERGVAPWPLNWAGALAHAARADAILCLGSSLKVLRKYPWLWAMDRPPNKRPAIFIVNLQWTPKDSVAALKINGRCDTVMRLVMDYLGLPLPPYRRAQDPLFAHATLLSPRELHTCSRPMLHAVRPDDDDDDDCPLNVLKMRMRKEEPPPDSDLEQIDPKPEIECDHAVQPIDVNFDQKPVKLECSKNQETKKVCKDEISVRMETSDFSCTVNVEERKDFSKELSDHGSGRGLSNLKINATINGSGNFKSDAGGDGSDEPLDVVEGISMEILAEEFERVHVEMKTDENEIRQVSILLVNKMKTSPAKCDKCQQTDPELSYGSESAGGAQPLGSGQYIQAVAAAHMLLGSTPQLNGNHSSTVSGRFGNSLRQTAPESGLDIKLSNSLRGFRRLKDSKPCPPLGITASPDSQVVEFVLDRIPGVLHNQKIKMEKSENPSSPLRMPIEPLDFSLRHPENSLAEVPVKESPKPLIKHSYILKVPKPPLLSRLSCILGGTPPCERAMDLTAPNGSSESREYTLDDEDANIVRNVYPSNRRSCTQDFRSFQIEEQSYVDFEKKCHSLARAIIQNTLSVSQTELQGAYSGIHSIIDPVPFNVQYDFKSVFNSLNFIRFGQKLMSEAKGSILPKNLKSLSESIKKKKMKFAQRRNVRKKKTPQCDFCFDRYGSRVCLFYTPFNSDDRFEKWRNDKPVMCDCCGNSDSDSSDEGSGEESESSKGKLTLTEDSAPEGDNNNKCNDDLKPRVQISVKDDSKLSVEKEGSTQPGWFGKGFRKNRRRKR